MHTIPFILTPFDHGLDVGDTNSLFGPEKVDHFFWPRKQTLLKVLTKLEQKRLCAALRVQLEYPLERNGSPPDVAFESLLSVADKGRESSPVAAASASAPAKGRSGG